MQRLGIIPIILLTASCGILKPEYRDYQESATTDETGSNLVSYSKSISSLISDKCTNCHNTGGEAPTLNSYESVKENAATSDEQISQGKMPPGTPLSSSETSLFTQWVNDGTAP